MGMFLIRKVDSAKRKGGRRKSPQLVYWFLLKQNVFKDI